MGREARRPASTSPHQISRITVHHSAVVLRDNRKAPAQLRAFQADHQSKGWPDIAYHLLIDRHGNVYQGRPLWAAGDTNTSYDPSGHLLVLALGNFQVQEISSAQFNATLNVLAWACTRYGIAPRAIRGHRAYANTLCPGDRFQRYITDGTVRRRVAGGWVRSPCGTCAGTPAGDGSARSRTAPTDPLRESSAGFGAGGCAHEARATTDLGSLIQNDPRGGGYR